jgi:hypothetical protein
MHTPRTEAPDDAAKRYLADIARINTSHGMTTTKSEEVYDEAVSQAADAFRWVESSQSGDRVETRHA